MRVSRIIILIALFVSCTFWLGAGQITSGTIQAGIYGGWCGESPFKMALNLVAFSGADPVSGGLCAAPLIDWDRRLEFVTGLSIPLGATANSAVVSAYGDRVVDYNPDGFIRFQLIAESVHYTGGTVVVQSPFTMNLEFGQGSRYGPPFTHQFTGSGIATLRAHEFTPQPWERPAPSGTRVMTIDSLVYEFQSVPEPWTLLPAGCALAGILTLRARRKRPLRKPSH